MKYNKEYMTAIFKANTGKNFHAQECVRLVRDNKELMKAWRKADDLCGFMEVVKSDEALKWSAFMVYWCGTVYSDWYYRREYCGKFATEFFKTTSDIGSLKIGCDGMKVLVGNHYGDGVNRVAIFDSCSHHDWNLSHLFPHSDVTVQGENIKVYSYDCGEDVSQPCLVRGMYTAMIASLLWSNGATKRQ